MQQKKNKKIANERRRYFDQPLFRFFAILNLYTLKK